MEGSYSGPAETQHLTPLVWIPLVPTPVTARMLSCTKASSQDLQHLLVRKLGFPPLRSLLHPSLPAECTSGSAFPYHIHHSCLPPANRASGDPAGSESSEPRGAQELLGTAPEPRRGTATPDSAQAGAGGLEWQLPLPALPRGSGSMCDSRLPVLLPQSPAAKESSEQR